MCGTFDLGSYIRWVLGFGIKIGYDIEAIQAEVIEDPPTAEVEVFFKLLKASEEPLHEHTEVTLSPSSSDWWPLSPSISYPIIATMISWNWSTISFWSLIKCLKTCTSPRKWCLLSVWNMRRLTSAQTIACFSGKSMPTRRSA
jgi:hypothetical protein